MAALSLIMKFQIVFENSGDSLPFVAINADLLCYFLDQINKESSQTFNSVDDYLGEDIFLKLKNLQKNILSTNKWIGHLTDKIYPEIVDEFEYLDQNLLNYLHAYWVKTQTKAYSIQYKKEHPTPISKKIEDIFPDNILFPELGTVISQLGLSTAYNSVNISIHKIEDAFSKILFEIKSNDYVYWNNPYTHLINNDICNLYVEFDRLGRTLLNKYENFDFDLKYDDENVLQYILPKVKLSLVPPRKVPYSPDYISWCKSKNRTPSGNSMPLGNIPNLFENIKNYRTVILKNLLNNNGFKLQKDEN
jgi:hypothetical protein